MRVCLPLLLVALATAACGSEPDAPAVPPGTPPADLVVDADGVAGLDADTPFDSAAVRAALPSGFTVERQPTGIRPVLWALRDGRLVLEVYPGDEGTTVGRVDVVGEEVAGPGGARVGYQTFADLEGADLDCEPGTGDLSGRAVCQPGRNGSIRYAFASQGITPGEPLPSSDALADALLERIVWTAE